MPEMARHVHLTDAERAHPGLQPAASPAMHRTPECYAAVDLGTNNCRLLIGAPTAAGFRVVDSFSRIVRLGEGLQGTGRLHPEAMDRALGALRLIAARIGRRAVRSVRAVATEACRRASNGRDFLSRAEAETGLHFDLISGREEAELALESCAPLLAHAGRRALLFDIGGGSTELAWIRLDAGAPALIGYLSLPVGVVTLAERFGADGFSAASFEAVVTELKARFAQFEQVHCIAHEARIGGVSLLGTSGTVTTLAGVALNLPRYRRPLVDGMMLTAQAASQALAILRSLGPEGLAAHPCVGPDRVEFVLPGCAVFEAIRQTWPLASITVADRGLREGILLRLMRDRRRRAPPRPIAAPRSALPLPQPRPA